MRIRVTRSFWYQGALVEKSTDEKPVVVDVPEHLARELIASNKAIAEKDDAGPAAEAPAPGSDAA